MLVTLLVGTPWCHHTMVPRPTLPAWSRLTTCMRACARTAWTAHCAFPTCLSQVLDLLLAWAEDERRLATHSFRVDVWVLQEGDGGAARGCGVTASAEAAYPVLIAWV